MMLLAFGALSLTGCGPHGSREVPDGEPERSLSARTVPAPRTPTPPEMWLEIEPGVEARVAAIEVPASDPDRSARAASALYPGDPRLSSILGREERFSDEFDAWLWGPDPAPPGGSWLASASRNEDPGFHYIGIGSNAPPAFNPWAGRPPWGKSDELSCSSTLGGERRFSDDFDAWLWGPDPAPSSEYYLVLPFGNEGTALHHVGTSSYPPPAFNPWAGRPPWGKRLH
jgi:hypothetical protein